MNEQAIKYPQIAVRPGEYGDGYLLFASVGKMLRAHVGIRAAEDWYDEAARAENYDALLQIARRVVTVA
jgi:hypothetical protein